MPGGNKNIKPEDGKQFSKEYQPAEKWTEEKALEIGNKLINWLKEKAETKDGTLEDKGNIFFDVFLYIENDCHPQLIKYLKKKFSSFSLLLKQAKKIQKIKLIKYSVLGNLNGNMTKFVLINHHGMSDKSETDLTTKGEKISQETTVTFINARKKDEKE